MVYGPSTNYSQPYYAAARPEIPNPGLSYSTPQPPQLKGRYVSSIDEVRAAQRDIDRPYGRMYYSDGNVGNQGGSRNSDGNSSTVGANSYYDEMMPYMDEYPIEMRDYREGRSPIARKMYMESKEMHQDPAAQMKELEHYIKELGDDVTEMIQDSTPEQKAILKQKISALAEKIV